MIIFLKGLVNSRTNARDNQDRKVSAENGEMFTNHSQSGFSSDSFQSQIAFWKNVSFFVHGVQDRRL